MSTAFYRFCKTFLILVIKHAMAVTHKIRICDLLPELFTDTLVILRHFKPAGAITALFFQPLFDDSNQFLIFIQPHSHKNTSFRFLHYIILS